MPQTPETRAEERYPDNFHEPGEDRPGFDSEYMAFLDQLSGIRKVHATCIREQVEPLEAERDRLRALVQVLGNAFTLADNGQTEMDGTKQAANHAHSLHAVWDMDNRKELAGKPCKKCLAFDAARNAAKEAGFTPTNTEDNG